MDLVWMTQNLHAVIRLCFSQTLHSAKFLKGWDDHMYKNRLMYSSLHAAEPYFFAKVLFAIDSALQIHWCSCSLTEDRLSVNDSVLHMTEIQYSILWLSFNQLLPKPISDKISNYLENNKDKDGNGKNGPGKNKLKGNGGDGKNSKINRKSSTIWLNLTFTGASRKGRISQRFFITTKKNVPKLPQEKQYAWSTSFGVCVIHPVTEHTLCPRRIPRTLTDIFWLAAREIPSQIFNMGQSPLTPLFISAP